MFFFKFFGQVLHDEVVEVTRTQISIRMMVRNFGRFWQEPGNSDSSLAMAKVDKADCSSLLFVEFGLFEEAVVRTQCHTLIHYSCAFEPCNLHSI